MLIQDFRVTETHDYLKCLPVILDMYPMTPFERALEIYDHLNAALEPVDKNCVEKIICEVGALAGDVGLTQNPILR